MYTILLSKKKSSQLRLLKLIQRFKSFVVFEERNRDLKSHCCMYRRKKKQIAVLYTVHSSLASASRSASSADFACLLGSSCSLVHLTRAFVVSLSSALLGRGFSASGLAPPGNFLCLYCLGLLSDFLHGFPARAL